MRSSQFLSVSALAIMTVTGMVIPAVHADTYETVQTTIPMSATETTRTTITESAPVIRETPVIVTPPANNETVIVQDKKKSHHLLNIGVPLLFHTSIF